MIGNQQSNKDISPLAVWSFITTTIFLVVCIFGEGMGGSLASNNLCYRYLGCTTGFAGYDAAEHFLFGFGAVFILFYIFGNFPKYSLLTNSYWKDIFIIIISATFISVVWEFYELLLDIFRFDVINSSVVANWKAHINLLAQPSNIDTIGDLVYGLIGSMIAIFFTKFNNLK